MKTFRWILLSLLLFACKEHVRRDEFDLVRMEKKMPSIAEKIKELKGLKVYQGTIPCADCPMIKQRLAIKGDTAGVFRLTETYVQGSEDGDAVIVSTGEWKRYYHKDSLGNKELRLLLSEGFINDSTRIQHYRVLKNKITQLDLNGKRIKSTWNYNLKLIYQDQN